MQCKPSGLRTSPSTCCPATCAHKLRRSTHRLTFDSGNPPMLLINTSQYLFGNLVALLSVLLCVLASSLLCIRHLTLHISSSRGTCVGVESHHKFNNIQDCVPALPMGGIFFGYQRQPMMSTLILSKRTKYVRERNTTSCHALLRLVSAKRVVGSRAETRFGSVLRLIRKNTNNSAAGRLGTLKSSSCHKLELHLLRLCAFFCVSFSNDSLSTEVLI